MVGADLLATGREQAEGVAASGEKRQHALLVVEEEVGKVTPPSLGVSDGIGAPAAGGIDDERVEEGHFLVGGGLAADDRPAIDDLRAGPSDARKKQWLAHLMFPVFAAVYPSL